MKRVLCVILLLGMLLLLPACGGKSAGEKSGTDTTQAEHTDTDTVQAEHSGKKIKGEITAASVFSEGFAFVCVDGNEEKTYCIDEEGRIVFELDEKIAVNGMIFEEFHNGYALIDGAICHTIGKLIYPEDVGVSEFSLLAIEDGYILTEIKNTTYDSTDIKIGIMDTSFQWILEPSTEIGNKLKGLPSEPIIGTKSYYKNGIVCFDVRSYGGDVKYLYLNVKTGEIYENSPYALPTEKWVACSNSYGSCSYQDYNENTVLDLSEKYDNVYAPTAFINGKAAILLLNKSEYVYFYTIIDEKGAFLFEPVEIENIPEIDGIAFDGEYALVSGWERENGDVTELFQCYNQQGEMVGVCNTSQFGKNKQNTCEIGDGVLVLHSSDQYYYFHPDFTPLF